MKKCYEIQSLIDTQLNKGGDAVLFALRLMLAYAFLDPALMKLQNFSYIVTWFGPGEGHLDLPFPALNAFLATAAESLGVLLLTLGFMTRFITVPLIITMIVAIVTVHGSNGFAMVQELSQTHYVFLDGQLQYETTHKFSNGFEIPFYYLLMLLVLATQGAGKYSLDHLLCREK